MRILLFCLALLFAVSGCDKTRPPPSKPIVLVSVPPYAYFVKRIAGDTVAVRSLVPVGASPHVYEPSPKDVQQCRQAALWIRLGEPSENKTYAVLREQSPQMRIVEITEGIALLPLCAHGHAHHHCSHHDESKDLHVWLSPQLAQAQAEVIAMHLCALFPNHAEQYTKALGSFLSDLKTIDRDIASVLACKQGAAILVSHPAFAYFCKDYRLDQLSIEVEGKEPLPKDITALLQAAETHQIASVIVEPQYSDKGAKLIGERLGLPLYVVDPYSEQYLDNLRFIAEVIAQ